MNFAPYQDDSPDTTRALSPPPAGHRRSASFSPKPRSPPPPNPSAWIQPLPPPDMFENRPARADVEQGRDLDMFGTSLPLRLDHEACLAYLLLPPAGSAFLLIVEHKSDYVRFHAWQSSLLFTILFLVHLILAWSKVLSYMLLAVDLGLIAWLTFRAYRDASTLDRCEVPIIGRLASSFVDDE